MKKIALLLLILLSASAASAMMQLPTTLIMNAQLAQKRHATLAAASASQGFHPETPQPSIINYIEAIASPVQITDPSDLSIDAISFPEARDIQANLLAQATAKRNSITTITDDNGELVVLESPKRKKIITRRYSEPNLVREPQYTTQRSATAPNSATFPVSPTPAQLKNADEMLRLPEPKKIGAPLAKLTTPAKVNHSPKKSSKVDLNTLQSMHLQGMNRGYIVMLPCLIQ